MKGGGEKTFFFLFFKVYLSNCSAAQLRFKKRIHQYMVNGKQRNLGKKTRNANS